MFLVLLFAALCASSMAAPWHCSYSKAVGRGFGRSFATDGEGKITAVRVWEANGAHIIGIQLRRGNLWTKRVGTESGKPQEIELFDGETIVQVSGKYSRSNYIYQVIFVTSRGRSLIVGQPAQRSFNFYPKYKEEELHLLSGRSTRRGITSLAAHWINDGNSSQPYH